jgi:hypothetical protein
MKRFWAGTLFILSLAAGAAAGLFYAWQVDPILYADAAPASLRSEDQLVYLTLIGDLYGADGDLEAATARLAALGMPVEGITLARFVEAHLAGGGQPERVRQLAHLAAALGGQGGVLQVFAPTATPSPIPRPSDALAPSPTPGRRFWLTEETALCALPGREGRVEVQVVDGEGQPLGGIELTVVGPGGGSSFFTGLKPEAGAGYADVWLAGDETYDIGPAAPGSDLAMGLSRQVPPGLCPTSTLGLEWRLTFQGQ